MVGTQEPGFGPAAGGEEPRYTAGTFHCSLSASFLPLLATLPQLRFPRKRVLEGRSLQHRGQQKRRLEEEVGQEGQH